MAAVANDRVWSATDPAQPAPRMAALPTFWKIPAVQQATPKRSFRNRGSIAQLPKAWFVQAVTSLLAIATVAWVRPVTSRNFSWYLGCSVPIPLSHQVK